MTGFAKVWLVTTAQPGLRQRDGHRQNHVTSSLGCRVPSPR